MTQWKDDVSNITLVTPQSLHIPSSRPTIGVMGCGLSEGKEWRESVRSFLQNSWPDNSFTLYFQDVELTDANLPWVDAYTNLTDYTFMHLGMPGSVNMLAMASRFVSNEYTWVTMDSQHPETLRNLLNSWAHNEILTSPIDQAVRMVAKRDSQIQ